MRYEENQNLSVWVYALLAVTNTAAIGGLLAAQHEKPELIWTLAFVVPVLLWVWDLMHLRIRVADGEIYAQLGRNVPTFWKHIPLKDVSELRVVRYSPLRDGGGWGWRIGRFEGAGCWFYNARGNRGVFFRTPQRNYILGSQEPEVLLAAIVEAQAKYI